MKKTAAFLIFVCILFIPTVGLAQYDYNSKEFQSIVSQLDMQGHSADDLATCSVKQLYYEEVLNMLNEDGMSEEEIIQYYVDQYGQAALKEPEFGKNGILAWVMPIVGIAAGIVIVGFWLKRVKGEKNTNLSQGNNKWKSETEREITEKIFEEERRKQF